MGKGHRKSGWPLHLSVHLFMSSLLRKSRVVAKSFSHSLPLLNQNPAPGQQQPSLGPQLSNSVIPLSLLALLYHPGVSCIWTGQHEGNCLGVSRVDLVSPAMMLMVSSQNPCGWFGVHSSELGM